MSAAIFVLLIGTALSDKVILYNNDDLRYEDEISPTSVILDESENEIRVDQKVSRYRGSSSYTYDKNNEDDGSYDGTWTDTIPGKSGQDFPSYSEIPKTSFTCKGKRASGYFADIETDCQVFHICMDEIQKISFLCPNGSIFNQKVLVCDWWYDVDCQSSVEYLEIHNDNLKNEELKAQQDYIFDQFALDEIYDLNLASSGGNQAPKTTTENMENYEETTHKNAAKSSEDKKKYSSRRSSNTENIKKHE